MRSGARTGRGVRRGLKLNSPADACVQFALIVPGVKSIALNAATASRVKSNLEMMDTDTPLQFWQQLKNKSLIETDFTSWCQSSITVNL